MELNINLLSPFDKVYATHPTYGRIQCYFLKVECEFTNDCICTLYNEEQHQIIDETFMAHDLTLNDEIESWLTKYETTSDLIFPIEWNIKPNTVYNCKGQPGYTYMLIDNRLYCNGDRDNETQCSYILFLTKKELEEATNTLNDATKPGDLIEVKELESWYKRTYIGTAADGRIITYDPDNGSCDWE